MLRMLPNMVIGSPFVKNWRNITVERVSSKPNEAAELYGLRPMMEGTARSAFYAGSLPPGQYKFVQFSTLVCYAGCASSTLTIGEKFSRFEIKAGTLTDLGVLVLSDTTAANRVAIAHDKATDPSQTNEIVRAYFPELVGMLAAPALSWKADSVPREMPTLFEYGKLVSFGFTAPRETSSNSFIYGSANGVVYSWTPGQEPVGHDTGVHKSIETTLVASGGQWLAGGELSMLHMSSDKGTSWRSMRGNLPLGVIVGLAQWRNKVIVTTLLSNQIHIHTAELGSTEWQAVAMYEMDTSKYWDVNGARAQSSLYGDLLITTIPGRNIASLDMKSGKSEINALPGAVHMFNVSLDGVLRCRCTPRVLVNLYESHDFGRTWTEAPASRMMMLPAYKDKKHGVAFKVGLVSKHTMMYTEDGGANWIETTEVPALSDLFYSRDGSVVYGSTYYGQLWTSRDNGKTWVSLKM
jgi:hypothetical protein